jgi:hypothetical protein
MWWSSVISSLQIETYTSTKAGWHKCQIWFLIQRNDHNSVIKSTDKFYTRRELLFIYGGLKRRWEWFIFFSRQICSASQMWELRMKVKYDLHTCCIKFKNYRWNKTSKSWTEISINMLMWECPNICAVKSSSGFRRKKKTAQYVTKNVVL